MGRFTVLKLSIGGRFKKKKKNCAREARAEPGGGVFGRIFDQKPAKNAQNVHFLHKNKIIKNFIFYKKF